jgi:hypothetical protein
MAIDWVTAGKIALAAGQAFLAHLQGRMDDAEREHDRDLILAAIQRAQNEILDLLTLLEVNQLRGELEGFRLIYDSYDPDPNDANEEGRLVSLIDDSARVLGRLGTHLDTVGSSPALALEAWTIYVPLLYLRAQAMTERQTTYGASELKDALESFDMAVPRLAGLLAYLRGQSDSQFGPVVCRPIPDSQDSRVCWYWWGNEQFICGSTRDPRGVDKCQRSRATNMDRAYEAFAGVREITMSAQQLEDARDALDTFSVLDILTQIGIDIGDLVIAHGRLVRSRRKADAAAKAADVVPPADWFS